MEIRGRASLPFRGGLLPHAGAGHDRYRASHPARPDVLLQEAGRLHAKRGALGATCQAGFRPGGRCGRRAGGAGTALRPHRRERRGVVLGVFRISAAITLSATHARTTPHVPRTEFGTGPPRPVATVPRALPPATPKITSSRDLHCRPAPDPPSGSRTA